MDTALNLLACKMGTLLFPPRDDVQVALVPGWEIVHRTIARGCRYQLSLTSPDAEHDQRGTRAALPTSASRLRR